MYGHVLRASLSLTRNFAKTLFSHCESKKCLTVPFRRDFCTAEKDEALNATYNPSHRISLEQEAEFKRKLDRLLEDPEKKKIYNSLEVEISVLRAQGEIIFSNLSTRQWLILLELKSHTQRSKYLKFLNMNATKNIKYKEKFELLKEKRLKALQEEFTFDHLTYGLHYNTMFLRVYKKSMNLFYSGKLARAIQFAPKVVFDLSYEEYMVKHEIHNCAKQLIIAYNDNRRHIEPFNLYMCNAQPQQELVTQIQRVIPQFLDKDFLVNVTPESYLDVFNRQELVYLTPHCNTPLLEYNPDMVYIIGGIVDKQNCQPLSLAKAKREGIQMRKLPMDNFLSWGAGSGKNLPLNIVLNILLDQHYTGDWNVSLNHVPRRKLRESVERRLINRIQKTESLLDRHQNKR